MTIVAARTGFTIDRVTCVMSLVVRKEQYRNSYGSPNPLARPNEDQAHHFAFFFVWAATHFGPYSDPDQAGAAIVLASGGVEIGGVRQGSASIGDYNLGIAAGLIGFDLARGAVEPRAVGARIRALCQ